MSKKMKLFLMICGIMIGAGAVFSIAGLAAGGLRGVEKIEEKVPWISFGPERMESRSIPCQPFTSVDLTSTTSDVEFIEGSAWRVEIVYAKRRGAPSVEINNNTLTIRPRTKNSKPVYLNFYGGSGEEEQIRIYYPKGRKFNRIKVDSDMGDLSLNGIAARSMQIASNAGDVRVSDLTADSLRLTSDMGDVEGSGLNTKAADIKINAGNLTLSGAFAGATTIDCNMGDCAVSTQLAKETYAIEADTDMGDCEVDGLEANGTYRVENAKAPNHLIAKTNAGDLELRFQ